LSGLSGFNGCLWAVHLVCGDRKEEMEPAARTEPTRLYLTVRLLDMIRQARVDLAQAHARLAVARERLLELRQRSEKSRK
jgi:hypothetical protein